MSVLTKHPTLRVIATILFIPMLLVFAPIAVVAVALSVLYDVADDALTTIEELFHA